KIMSCQIFSGNTEPNALATVRAIKYAADNGAVILQCSWGYTSGLANGYEWQPAFTTEEQWAENRPLEQEALDYFVHNAGSPNGPIDGGLAIFAGGNETA
ncbi:MAG TPA: peptidase S8, partial [Alistipes sp.]|nr:peptidase S8 [Alistipes sp.]